ncbi:peptidase S8 [Actinotalea ferrariae CF5-4]|uniref:Peptidase S8 n=1 Tax=Actinotalea ferrariae CF5-4 TaxID=948458 RepID=A0A021VTV9_9CELL|nr:S8 family serine peptidase [Actinotalea ferrariae]EYR64591.1 peptidase S8 [Actinotalea ferrariae CF5-4]
MTQKDTGGATRRRRLCAGLGATALLLAGTATPFAVAAESGPQDLGSAADLGVAVPTGTPDLTQEYATSPTGAWFVELEPRPTSRGGSAAAVGRAQEAFLAQAKGQGIPVEVRQRFSSLWSGVSARIDDDDVAAVADLPGVAAVHPVLEVDAPQQASSFEPEMLTALAMTGADVAQSELGHTGAGIRVGVVDTGIDTDHPDFGGSGTDGTTAFPSARVVAGYDFVGDDFNADDSSPGYQPVPAPDGDPDDCQGHGTHVAGIVGANGDTAAGGVRGVAPEVELGAYRVFGCEGSTTSDIIVAALERALADGMDVVNQSLGAAFQSWPEYPTAVASDNLVAAGVVMVASIGNSGASGTWSAGAPGVGDDVIGVASFDNTAVTAQVLEVDGREVAYSPGAGAPQPPTSGSLPLVALGAPGTAAARSCEAVPADLVAGAAVLIERGASAAYPGCDPTFYAKALRAQQAGAAAVVLYNNVPGMFSPSVAGAVPITIPVVAVTNTDGAALTAATADGATLTWTDQVGSVQNPTGGLVSSFSSYGLTADLQLKPDLGAPGGSIYSTYPLENGRYATLSGTSMSAPHVAGAVALLLEARPDLGATEVRDLLQNSAEPAVWSLNRRLGFLEPVHRQGAGMIQVDEAILADTRVTPGKLSLGESEGGPVERTLTVTNDGEADVTYATSFEDAISTGGNPDAPGFTLGTSDVQMPATLTVPAGGSAELVVSIAPDAGLDLVQYGGYLRLTPVEGSTEDDVLGVPFAGFAGDYQGLEALGDLGTTPFPLLASLTACDRLIGVGCVAGGEWDVAGEGAVFTMVDGDVPSVLTHVEHPLQSLTIRAYRVLPGTATPSEVRGAKSLVGVEEHVGRDSGGFSVRTWDGTLAKTSGKGRITLPDGVYVLEVTALKALGDPANPAHVETWTSPAFTVDRPGR